MSSLPLSDIKVLDFGHTIMGPCAGLVLADLGADVIRIEPLTGDPTRRLSGFGAGFFSTFNRNKRSMAIDLKNPEGRGVLDRLIASSDVMLENFGPGTSERLGCDWAHASTVNPRIVHLSLKGYLSGPYERRTALDEVVQMQSGLAYMTGPPGQPLRAGASIVDILGAVYGVVGVLAALRERDRTGEGSRVAASLFESAAFLLGPFIAGGTLMGIEIPPMPARRNAWGVYDLFHDADGRQFFLGITSDTQWQRFKEHFGFGDDPGAPSEALATNRGRIDARTWLIPQLAELLRNYRLDDILAVCLRFGIPCARVGRPEDLAVDPHLMARGGLISTDLGEGKTADLPGLPLEFGAEAKRLGLRHQPPRFGEHTREILAELGFAPKEIAGLLNRNVLAESAKEMAEARSDEQ